KTADQIKHPIGQIKNLCAIQSHTARNMQNPPGRLIKNHPSCDIYETVEDVLNLGEPPASSLGDSTLTASPPNFVPESSQPFTMRRSDMLQKRALGWQGLRVSALGLGCMG